MGVYQDAITSNHFLNHFRWHRLEIEELLKDTNKVYLSWDMIPGQWTDMINSSGGMGELGDG